MIAYRYNSLMFYIGEVECQLNPLETKAQGKEVYILPANATEKKPTLKDGYTPRWNGKTWEQYADDKKVYGYTDNADGTINYYGSAHTEEELQARVKDVDLLFSGTEPVSVDDVYWLSADNPAYIEAKKAHEQQEKLAVLDSQYEADKAEIMKYYVDSVIHMDVDLTNELADEMILLDRQYKKDREEIEKE